MRILLCTTLLSLPIISAIAQKAEDTTRNVILSFEFYQPVQDPGIEELFSIDWKSNLYNIAIGNQLDVDYDQTSNHSKINIGAGIAYEWLLKDSTILRPRIGFSTSSERAQMDVGKYPNNFTQEHVYAASYSSRKMQVSGSLGYGKKFFITDRVHITAGVQVPFLYNFNRHSELSWRFEYYMANDDTVHGESWRHDYIHQGNSFSTGVGPMLVPEFEFKNKWVISCELQCYYLFNFSRQPHTYTSTQAGWADIVLNSGIPYFITTQDFQSLDITTFGFGWSNLSATFRLGYRF